MGRLFLFALLAIATSANAQSQINTTNSDDKGVIYSDSHTWIDFNIPKITFDGTDTAPGTEKVGNVGATFGWAPFEDNVTDQDNFIQAFVKNLQFTFSFNAHKPADFDNYVATVEAPRNYYSCVDNQGQRIDYDCVPCRGFDSYYCQREDIYSRDTDVSYVDESVQLGIMVPFQLGDKFAVSMGPELSFLMIQEGRVTTQLRRDTEVGRNWAVRAEYDIGNRWGLSATARKSFSGPKTDTFHFGGYVKFR